MRRLLLAAAMAAALVLIVAGCGGGSSSSSTGSTSTTTTSAAQAGGGEYVNQANEVCRGAHEANSMRTEELAKIFAHGLTSPAIRDRAAGLILDAIPAEEGEIEGFEKLTPPAGLEHTHERMISKVRWSIALDRLFAKALEGGSTHELGVLLGRIIRNELAFRGAALHLGLKVCGKLLRGPEGGHGLA